MNIYICITVTFLSTCSSNSRFKKINDFASGLVESYMYGIIEDSKMSLHGNG